MKTYLVVLDGSEEAAAALRFAALRSAGGRGRVEILAVAPKPEFSEWSAVQAAMDEEARLRAEAMVAEACGTLDEEAGIRPAITVHQGDPAQGLTERLERGNIQVLVLAAAREGGPGVLVSHFTALAGTLPCLLVIVPAGLDEQALGKLAE